MVVDRGVVARRDGEGWKEERKPFYLVKHKVMVVMVMVMIVVVILLLVVMAEMQKVIKLAEIHFWQKKLAPKMAQK